MNLTIKKTLAVLLAGVMLLSLVACSAKPAASGTADGTDAPATDAGIDLDAIAAKVGDMPITVGTLLDAYNGTVSAYEVYGGIPAPTAEADIETMQDEVLSNLISQQMLLYQAKQQGFDTLSAEQEAELAEAVNAQTEEIISYFSQDAETEGSEEDIRNAAIEAINKELAANGYAEDFDDYCAQIEKSLRENMIAKNLEEAVKATATVTEDEVRGYYDTLYAEQQASLEDPSKYLTAEEEYEMNGGTPMLIVPQGFARVKVLSVMPTGTIDEGYDTLLTEMAELEAEYGRLSLSDTPDNTRLSEIKTTYAAKKLESDKMFEAYSASAKAKINEAYQKLQAGEAFNEVFAAYNEDATYSSYEAFATRGRLMMPAQDDGAWDDALRAAAAGLTAGQYSGIVEVEGSYYIVYLVGEETPGDVAYDTVYETMKTLALEQRQNTVWEEQRETWDADESLVTYFQDAYRAIGK